MNSISNINISALDAMNIALDKTIKDIHPSHAKKIDTRVFIENPIHKNADTKTSKTELEVKEIFDNYNNFITEEKRKTHAKIKDEETKIEQLLKLEDLLCEKSTIFHEMIDSVYSQIKKDIIIDHKKTVDKNIRDKLSDINFAIKNFDKKLTFLEKEIKNSIINYVEKVNQLIDKIHDITMNIRYFPIARMHDEINHLMEQREIFVDELNSLIGVVVVKDHDNYKISLENGITLIDNNEKQTLIPLIADSDDKYVSIGYIDPNEKTVKKIENMISTAILGSLLSFRKEELNNTRNKIGQLIINFAASMNEYNQLGNDIFQNNDKPVFNFSDPESIASSSNTSSTKTYVKWYSPRDAKDTDYIIYFKDNKWTVKRLIDNSIIPCNVCHQDNLTAMNFDGMQFFIEGKNADGDIYMVRPYSKTLETLELSFDHMDPFSLSSPEDTNNTQLNNTLIINKFYEDVLLHRQENIDQDYQKFSKSISYKYNFIKERLPFKKNMIKILENKQITMPNDIDKNYNDTNYDLERYLATVKVLEIAEKIFNEIIEQYS